MRLDLLDEENQKWVIEGQQRTIERVSYINGKYCKFNR
jgi:hypothetical protein